MNSHNKFNDLIRLNRKTHPQLAKFEIGRVITHATIHAISQAATRNMNVPGSLYISAGSVVELEARGREIIKLVCRFRDVAGIDNVYVIRPVSDNVWLIITMYVNQTWDNHETLDMNRLGRISA